MSRRDLIQACASGMVLCCVQLGRRDQGLAVTEVPPWQGIMSSVATATALPTCRKMTPVYLGSGPRHVSAEQLTFRVLDCLDVGPHLPLLLRPTSLRTALSMILQEHFRGGSHIKTVAGA